MAELARSSRQIGALIRRHRERAGLTQAQLAGRVGTRQATISKAEAGHPIANFTLFKILAALDLELLIAPRSKGKATDIADLL